MLRPRLQHHSLMNVGLEIAVTAVICVFSLPVASNTLLHLHS
jgi:hypothetical protein